MAIKQTEYYVKNESGGYDPVHFLTDADIVSVADAGGYYTSSNAEGVLQEIGSEMSGIVQNTYPGQKQNIDIDIERFAVVYPQMLLSIPSYVGDPNNEMVHPSVLYFPNEWHEHKYWMCITPYPSAQNIYENPSIFVSEDGIAWSVPSGLTNPIEAKPASGYNADPYVFMSPDNSTMFLVYKVSGDTGSTESIYMKSSEDGINWTARQQILSTAATSEQNVSPCILWDAANSQWIMYTINILPSTHVLQYRTCSTLTGTWSEATVCSISNVPNGKEPWHFEIRRFNNIYLLIINYMNSGELTGGVLRLAYSTDGLNWVSATQPLAFSMTSFYKTSGILVQEGNLMKLKIWMGKVTPYNQIFYKEIIFKAKSLNSILQANQEYNLDLFAGINGLKPAVFGDNFARTDSATSLGTSPSGITWTTINGTIGILGGKAYLPANASSRAVVDIGISDFKAGVELSSLNCENWLLFRYSSTTNYYRFGCSGSSATTNHYSAQIVISGTAQVLQIYLDSSTVVDLYAYTAQAGDRVEVECVGSLIKFFINGLIAGYAINTNFLSATKIGLQASNANVSFDNIYARRVY